MTKQNLKTIALIVLAGLAVGATGCKCVCRANKSAGIPIILCQPADQEVSLPTNDCPQTATFRVDVQARCPLRFAWFKLVPAKEGYREEFLQERVGHRSNELKIENVSTNDRALYYCAIAHEAGGGLGDLFTRTRLAELKVYAPIAKAMSNTQLSSGQLQGAVAGTNGCVTGQFAASLPFPKDDTAKKFVSKGTTCALTVTQAGTLLANDQFGVRWTTPLTKPKPDSGCAGLTPDQNTRSFIIRHGGTPHTFVVYLKTAAPIGTTYQLSVTWQ